MEKVLHCLIDQYHQDIASIDSRSKEVVNIKQLYELETELFHKIKILKSVIDYYPELVQGDSVE